MKAIIHIAAIEDFRLYVVFADGAEGVVDLSERLFGPVFEPLRDPAYFAQVFIDEFGAPAWPNGTDLAPDALYAQLAATNTAAE